MPSFFMEGKWLLKRNEGLYLNSKAGDFGITFLNDTVGYFSSNREGGKGEGVVKDGNRRWVVGSQ